MSVRKSERKEGKLELAMLARNHAKYVIQITSNPKIFDPKYSNAVTDDLIRAAKTIYRHIWTANNIRVSGKFGKEKYKLRYDHQIKAALLCNTLLADMELAQSIFHLKGKRMRYWTNMVVEIRNKTKAWMDSDAKRFEDYR